MTRKGRYGFSPKGGPSPQREGQFPASGPPPGPWKEAREGEFEMMDVSVTVLGVAGIVNEFVKTKKKPIGPGPKKANATALVDSNASVMSSLESSMYDVEIDDIPITAVASVYKNVTSNKTKIGTHLPSLPLGMPTSAFGNTSRFMASWPSSSRPSADAGAGASSFKFSRVMKRQIIPGSWDGEDPSVIQGNGHGVFVPEMVDISLGLARGSEMLPLGVATLVVSGGEVGEVQVNLPIKTGEDAIAKDGRGPKLFKGKKKAGKVSKKGVYFNFNPSSRYRLDDKAALRLLVKAVPRNGGYDVDGSVVSALSCPTGSSEGDSSTDYDDDYDEDGTPGSPRSPQALSPRSPKVRARTKAQSAQTQNLPGSQAQHTATNMLQRQSSEVSSEPGYGDEFEGLNPQVPPPESRPAPIQIPAKSYSKGSKETDTTKTSMSDSGSFVLQVQATSTSACNKFFECGSLCQTIQSVALENKKKGKSRKVQRRPPRQVFTHPTQSDSHSSGSHSPRDRHRARTRARGTHGRGDRRHGEAFTYNSSSSSSGSSHSVGSRTYHDVENAREKLRRYAHKMGVKPEDLV